MENQADITGVFISGFQIKFVFFFSAIFNTTSESDDAEKGFSHFFLPLRRFHEMIMMIEEMDFKGDGKNFHLHQTSSFPTFLPSNQISLSRFVLFRDKSGILKLLVKLKAKLKAEEKTDTFITAQ